ncbi:glycosyltransferase [Diaminobutyricimonas sp. TR449]|uniref:glycosyltransferase n=1 Tax=Diaminobutyricimonas sp. TR449 TaxID=2708076 RepID=UPI0014213626|nr:glycosyltransferase [Diaminobutyricimonas sp. TR449]
MQVWGWPWVLVYPAVLLLLMTGIWMVQRTRPGFCRRLAIVLSLIAGALYLSWRIGFTIPTGSVADTIVGVTLIVVEIIGFAQTVAFSVIVWSPAPPPPVPLSTLSRFPSVDVFIATYNEPVSTLRLTLAGAVNLRYPGPVSVYLCDDGSRAEVRELADEFGARHLTRTDHSHAKAGNLNNALANSSGELVVTLDADMVPKQDFLEKTVGHFSDDALAFVQAPQAFYNQDPFQYNLFSGQVLPNEQDFFMRTLQGAKARFNATMYVGSNTVFRRTALEAIGGFATGVITEDMATGMLLQSAGFRSTYVPDVIAAGLAPESFPDLLKQRDRWSRGNVQSARKWNPLTMPGFTPMQRWLYSDGVVYWYFGVFKLVYLIAPLLFLLFGVVPVNAELAWLAVFWLPFFVTSMLSFRIVADGRRSFLWSHVYELAMAPTLAISTVAETFGLKVTAFAVTPKGMLSSNRQFHWRIALPHLVLLALSVIGLLNVFAFNPQAYSLAALVISVLWTVYNAAGLLMAVLICIERPRVRTAERVPVDLPVSVSFTGLGSVPGRIVDLSVGGARIFVPFGAAIDAGVLVDAAHKPTAVDLAPVGAVSGQSRWIVGTNDGVTLGFVFDPLSTGQWIDLVSVLSSSPAWVRNDREVGARLTASLGRTVAGTASRVAAHARRDIRVPANAPALVRPLTADMATSTSRESAGGRHSTGAAAPVLVPKTSEALPATVEDYSFGGARLFTKKRLEPGGFVSIEIPDRLEIPEVAEVRWVRRSTQGFRAGVLFARTEASRNEQVIGT